MDLTLKELIDMGYLSPRVVAKAITTAQAWYGPDWEDVVRAAMQGAVDDVLDEIEDDRLLDG